MTGQTMYRLYGREKQIANAKRWNKAHPEKMRVWVREQVRKYRARKKAEREAQKAAEQAQKEQGGNPSDNGTAN